MVHEDLLSKRLLLVTGKGGTGKTTCAAALALLAARRGKRCLLLEVERSTAARTIFGVRRPGTLVRKAAPGIDIESVDLQSGVEELVFDIVRVPGVVRAILRHSVIKRFFRATPSALDYVAMFVTWKRASSMRPDGDCSYDLVVVDLPALGHARTMLAVGRTAHRLFRVGPIAARGGDIDRLISDPSRCAIVVITLPEEMPVTETIEGCVALRTGLGLDARAILVNATQPVRLERREVAVVERMVDAAEATGDLDSARALALAAERARWAAERQRRIERLTAALGDVPVVELPLFAGAVAGVDLAKRVGDAIAATPERLHRIQEARDGTG